MRKTFKKKATEFLKYWQNNYRYIDIDNKIKYLYYFIILQYFIIQYIIFILYCW